MNIQNQKELLDLLTALRLVCSKEQIAKLERKYRDAFGEELPDPLAEQIGAALGESFQNLPVPISMLRSSRHV